MLRKIGLLCARARAKASSFHANQSTGLCACWRRYGDFSCASRLVCFASMQGSICFKKCRSANNFASSLVHRLDRLADMLWKKTWELEAVLALIGGIVAAFFFGYVASMLLRQAQVSGFK